MPSVASNRDLESTAIGWAAHSSVGAGCRVSLMRNSASDCLRCLVFDVNWDVGLIRVQFLDPWSQSIKVEEGVLPVVDSHGFSSIGRLEALVANSWDFIVDVGLFNL